MSSPLPIVVLLMTALCHSLGDFHSPCNGEKVRENYRLTSVTTCPTGDERIMKAKSCNFSSNVFHCLPDENGNLYLFCGKRKRHLRYRYFVVDKNDTLHLIKFGLTAFPGTESEIYSNLSQVVINAPDSLQRFPIFEKLQQELNLTATDSCRANVKGYVLPSRASCNFISTCALPRYVPCITIHIVNASNGYGSIIEREFPLSKTNKKKYAIIASVLCQNNLSTLRAKCLKLSVTQNPVSSTTNTVMYSKDPLPSETTSQQSCHKNETQVCQECNTTGHSIIIGLLIIIITGMGLEMKFRFIKKQCLKRRLKLSENQKGEYSHPTDTYDINHQSSVVPSTN